MKKMIVMTTMTLLSIQALASEKLKPTDYLKGTAYVYKIRDIDTLEGTREQESTEVCKVDIKVASFKVDNLDDNKEPIIGDNICYGKVMEHDVTISFNMFHVDQLIQKGTFSKQYGLEAWINKRVNAIVGFGELLPGKLKLINSKETGANEIDFNNPQQGSDYNQIQKLLPDYNSSFNTFRGSVHNGFSTVLDLDNSTVCNRLGDVSGDNDHLRTKCFNDGHFRIVMIYEGKQ